jgi:hypothetical protein
MKRGKGIKGLDDKSSGIEILVADAFAKINPTDDPLILAKQASSTKKTKMTPLFFLFLKKKENREGRKREG